MTDDEHLDNEAEAKREIRRVEEELSGLPSLAERMGGPGHGRTHLTPLREHDTLSPVTPSRHRGAQRP